MSRWSKVTLCAALALGTGATLLWAEQATTQPAAKPAAAAEPAAAVEAKAEKKAEKAERKTARLTRPWNEIGSLSEEQKEQIRVIHGQALAEINAIEAREKAEIMALLTDAQKLELQELLDKKAAERKAAKSEGADAAGGDGEASGSGM